MNKSTRAMVRCVVSALIGNVKNMGQREWPVIEESTNLRDDLKLDAADITELTVKLEYETKAGLDPNHVAYKCETVKDLVDYTSKLIRQKKKVTK